ncbi:MAG: 16S rRNA (guanine(527)-N(7))-methyltransferase RsmG [Spirochaetales bacterium]|nr:16S rRNA (guanine(527)-N(7))-methyltransferase RsmG [Spirochaetales bacterium]
MSGNVSPVLEEGLAQLDIPFNVDQLLKLHVFLQELERWNKAYGFVKAAGQQLIIRHVLDSLSAWRKISALPRRAQVVDVGSGAGFPGIPLAVFLADSRFTLLEPSAKKAAFLRNVAILAHLDNVEVEEARLEDVERRFDLVVFRAFTPLHREIDALRRILNHNGVIIAYKGKRARILEEIDEAGISLEQVLIEAVEVPFLSEERHLVILSTFFSES